MSVYVEKSCRRLVGDALEPRRQTPVGLMSSIGGLIGPTGRAVYAAGKFGVEGFSEYPSKKVEPLGTKVAIVEPAAFEPLRRLLHCAS